MKLAWRILLTVVYTVFGLAVAWALFVSFAAPYWGG